MTTLITFQSNLMNNTHQQPSKKWDDVFDYKDGVLFWKEKSPGRKSNGIAGCTCKQSGYVKLCYNGKAYQAHRIVWEMFNSPIPKGMEIDHFNRNRSDNRIENLRLATRSENSQNMKTPKTNTSGFKGVILNKNTNRWQAMIRLNSKRIYLGAYDLIEDAVEAYKKAENDYHITKPKEI